MSSRLATAAMVLFILQSLPLLALAFFSAGLQHENWVGWAIFAVAVLTLGLLLWLARRHRWLWFLVGLQLFWLGLVFYEALTGRLYAGT